MICFSVIDSLPCFFNATDYENALLDIESLLEKTGSIHNGTQFSGEKVEKKAILEKAYSKALSCLSSCRKDKPEKQLMFLMGDIVRRYAHLCYDDSYQASKQCLLAALNLHFYAMGILDRCIHVQDFSSLKDLSLQGIAKPNLFSFMEDLISNMHMDSCLTQAYTSTFVQAYPARRLFNLADIMRWLGHCYQYIDKYSSLSSNNDHRFQQLFSLAESILLIIDTPESVRELGDLCFQAWPFMHQRKHPEDIDGICALYNKALACDSSTEMQVRVANMRFLDLFKAGKKEEAAKYIKQALSLIDALTNTLANGFLRANVHYNYAGYLMDPATLDLEQAEEHLQEAISFASHRRSVDEDHLYFAIYDMRLAELRLALDKCDSAAKVIKSALITLHKYPESNEPFLEKAVGLQTVIAKFRSKEA